MELYVRCQDREVKVAVDVRAGRHHVTVGERAYVVESARIGSSWSLIVDGRQSEATVFADGAAEGQGRYWVSTPAGSEAVEVLEPLAYLAARSRRSGGRRGADQVRAIMPGRVVSVLVEPGERVVTGQGVLVLEAMKMENEIAAESDGVVSALHVEVGSAVEAGDSLFDVGPPAEAGVNESE